MSSDRHYAIYRAQRAELVLVQRLVVFFFLPPVSSVTSLTRSVRFRRPFTAPNKITRPSPVTLYVSLNSTSVVLRH